MKIVFLVIAILCFVVSPAYAGKVTGKITHVFSGPGFGTKVFFAMDTEVSEKPACQINTLYSFALDSQAPGADAWLSMVYIAYSSGKSVYVEGNGECNHWSSIEDMTYFRLNP